MAPRTPKAVRRRHQHTRTAAERAGRVAPRPQAKRPAAETAANVNGRPAVEVTSDYEEQRAIWEER